MALLAFSIEPVREIKEALFLATNSAPSIPDLACWAIRAPIALPRAVILFRARLAPCTIGENRSAPAARTLE